VSKKKTNVIGIRRRLHSVTCVFRCCCIVWFREKTAKRARARPTREQRKSRAKESGNRRVQRKRERIFLATKNQNKREVIKDKSARPTWTWKTLDRKRPDEGKRLRRRVCRRTGRFRAPRPPSCQRRHVVLRTGRIRQNRYPRGGNPVGRDGRVAGRTLCRAVWTACADGDETTNAGTIDCNARPVSPLGICRKLEPPPDRPWSPIFFPLFFFFW